jgi:hypothetical protein
MRNAHQIVNIMVNGKVSASPDKFHFINFPSDKLIPYTTSDDFPTVSQVMECLDCDPTLNILDEQYPLVSHSLITDQYPDLIDRKVLYIEKVGQDGDMFNLCLIPKDIPNPKNIDELFESLKPMGAYMPMGEFEMIAKFRYIDIGIELAPNIPEDRVFNVIKYPDELDFSTIQGAPYAIKVTDGPDGFVIQPFAD